MTGSQILHSEQTTRQQVREILFLTKKLGNIKVYGGYYQGLKNKIMLHMSYLSSYR